MRNGLRYPKALWVSLVMLGLFSWCMFNVMVHTSPEDRAEYLNLMSQSDSNIKSNQASPYSVAQNRTGIRKDYYFTQGVDRLHLRVLSEKASLMMHQGGAGSSLMEKMQNVNCFMQEELFYQLPNGKEAVKRPDGQLSLRHDKAEKPQPIPPEEVIGALPMQTIRYFNAKEASYHYQSGQFTGQTVQIMHYTAPGHELPLSDIAPSTKIKGSADSIEFSLNNGEPNFNAFGFKAQLRTAGTL